MGGSHIYTDYHPRWLRRKLSTYWWLEKRAYVAFILREGSCMFVAWFVVYLLLLVNSRGRRAWQLRAVPRMVRDALGADPQRRQLPVHRLPRDHLFCRRAAGDGGAHRP